MLKTCDILRITNEKELSKLLQHCDDQNFPKHYECSKIHLKGYDCVYIGFDKENNKICGYVHVQVFANFFELTAIASRSRMDMQYKGNMKTLFDQVVIDAKDKDFIMIDAYSPDGLKFYTRYGFKLIGRTGRLVFPLKRLPTIEELRKLDIFYKLSSSSHMKLHFKKSQDNAEFQKKMYGTLENQEWFELNVEDISVILDTSNVPLYPDYMYKYSKAPWPISDCKVKSIQCLKKLKILIGI
jgi:N-acetylglutamate synthase-like GNAT family acetyltransferase